MEGKRKVSILNIALIIMLVLCLTMGTAIILLSSSKTQIEIAERSGDKNNATAEETSETNTWDISATENDNVIATLSDDGTLTISGIGKMKDFNFYNSDERAPWYGRKEKIKKAIIEQGVTNIGVSAFENCENMKNIKIADSITSIGHGAFVGCSKLVSINIPERVIEIGNYAFSCCYSLITIEIPEFVQTIGNNTFNLCSKLESIEVDKRNLYYMDDNGVLYTKDNTELIQYPEEKKETDYAILNGTITIQNEAFYGCQQLRNIKIPASVTDIGINWFVNNYYLTDIEVDENNTNYCDDDGVLYTKDKSELIKYPPGKSARYYKISDNTTTISSYAFKMCNRLNEIKIPEGVNAIGSNALAHCRNLNNIEIPKNISKASIGLMTGSRIVKFIEPTTDSIEVPEILKRTQDENDLLYSEGGLTFKNCNVENGMIKISNTSKATIKVNSGVLSNMEYTIMYNKWDISEAQDESLMAVLSSDGTLTVSGSGKIKTFEYLNDIPWYGFQNYIEKIYITEEVNDLGLNNLDVDIFYDCQLLTDIEVNEKNQNYKDDNGVLYTKDGTQLIKYPEGKKQIEYIISSNAIKIGYQAFENSRNLERIIIPENIAYIDNSAFYMCDKLEYIEVAENNTNYMDDNGVLYTKDKTKIIKYPEGKKETEYIICSNSTTIGYYAFLNCRNLEKIIIHENIVNIGYAAFASTPKLISIEVNENNKNYMDDNGVLYTKDKTKIIKYPEGKKENNYTILNGVITIEDVAFAFSKSLTNVEIPNSVTKIGLGAFGECINLDSIKIPNSVKILEEGAFMYCEKLSTVIIPESLTNIGNFVFYECDDLTIWCKKDSAAHIHAQKNQINYLLIMDDIQPKTTAQQIKEKIGTESEYKILDIAGNEVADTEIVLTGYTAQTDSGENYLLTIKGDCNGDGQADIKDILAINKHRLNKVSLTMEYSLAGDVNGDGQVDTKDILQINKFRLGKIEQL